MEKNNTGKIQEKGGATVFCITFSRKHRRKRGSANRRSFGCISVICVRRDIIDTYYGFLGAWFTFGTPNVLITLRKKFKRLFR